MWYTTKNDKKGTKARAPYEHQKRAMECLDHINAEPAYSTLVVLPTDGGKTYRKVIDYVRNMVPSVKPLGLTATSFRTAEDEQGLPAKIYSDDIAYQIAVSAVRNKLTVDAYRAKREKWTCPRRTEASWMWRRLDEDMGEEMLSDCVVVYE